MKLTILAQIKMKSNAVPTHYTPRGLAFSDGAEIAADVIIFSTGFVGNMRTDVARIFGQEVASRADDFWGLDEEGELRGVFKRNSRAYCPSPPLEPTFYSSFPLRG